MHITEEAAADFKKLWEETYGEEIDHDTAREYARQLVSLLKVVYFPEE